MKVVFFGDSICFGQGVSIHKGWVPRVAARVDELAAELGREMVIVNASKNGRTTRDALENMPYEVQSQGVDLLLVQFGMNDCNFWQTDRGLPRVSPDAFAANLHEIIERGRKFGAREIILNTNHPTTLTDKILAGGEAYESGNKRYNEIIREVARKEGADVWLNDMESHFRSHIAETDDGVAGHVLDDGLHLSIKGHDLYYNCVAPLLEKVIRKCI
ncbi:SGNH/GDSL hydrolase family protein [Aestuariispira ectoiniformans]|uniref:SGNH/GDSL hydrolase family protein n=1 Tax=Aestuariispira ectoiniformans TaxID=2775080 RepID=UPI00223AED3E|nr:SGNH/GDSL hydrolase family protein [Aestuariispira ectoiniformans]